MKSKIRLIFLVLAILAVVLLFTYFRPFTAGALRQASNHSGSKVAGPSVAPSAAPGGETPRPESNLPEPHKQNVTKIAAAFSAPISFFGKVIDQNGQPVSQAKVYYSAADQYFGDSSKYYGSSDRDGLFSITGIKGAGVYVSVSKDGYEGSGSSHGSFGYGVPSGQRPPSSEEPALFVLRKKAEAEPLLYFDKDIVLPLNGTPVSVSLVTGKIVPRGRGDLVLELWAAEQLPNTVNQFSWKFRLSVPGGGVARREKAEMQFEAPETEYGSPLEINLSDTSSAWRNSYEDDFFVKLADGRYGRMRFRITPAGGHFASIRCYLNPTPGSRNLEFDPKKQIKVQ